MRKSKCRINKLRMTMIVVVFIIVLSFFFLSAIEKKMAPKIHNICEYYCKSEISQIVNTSIFNVMELYQIEYNDIAVKVKENGKISAIDIRTENVNIIQSAIIKEINNNFKTKYNNEISIPLGNISDIFIFSGKGPEIKVQFLPETAVTTQIKSDFHGAGINQTRHTLSLEISVEAIAVLPTEKITLNIKSECILAESILMGDVPKKMITSS